jgi:cytochrome c
MGVSPLRRVMVASTLWLAAACEPSASTTDGRVPASRDPAARTARLPDRWTPLGVGRPVDAARLAAWDLDVDTLGAGLPPGRGTPAEGATLYAAKCAACHGANGEGLAPMYPALIGRAPREGFGFGRDPALVRTVGNYWPYATTLFDYIRRAMPYGAPGTLSADETYAVTAYLLRANEIIDDASAVDSAALVAVRMPARGRFIADPRAPGRP